MHHKWRQLARVELSPQRGDSLPGSCQCGNLLQSGSQEGSQAQSGQTPANEALHCLLGAEHDERRAPSEEAGHVGHDVVDGDDGHREDVPHHAVAESQVQEVPSSNKIKHCQVCQSFRKMYVHLKSMKTLQTLPRRQYRVRHCEVWRIEMTNQAMRAMYPRKHRPSLFLSLKPNHSSRAGSSQ